MDSNPFAPFSKRVSKKTKKAQAAKTEKSSRKRKDQDDPDEQTMATTLSTSNRARKDLKEANSNLDVPTMTGGRSSTSASSSGTTSAKEIDYQARVRTTEEEEALHYGVIEVDDSDGEQEPLRAKDALRESSLTATTMLLLIK